MLEHGGNLRAAARRFGRPVDQWLDLSTGINPTPWPIPPIPPSSWSRLPEDDDGLLEIAANYYGCRHILAVAGSQMAIQALPQLRSPSSVAMLHPSYNEHRHAWLKHHHKVSVVEVADIDGVVEAIDVLLLVNPNNPTAQRFETEQLLSWHASLVKRGGWLIVDEAFLDCRNEQSLAQYSHLPGLIVLRSFGKFFGLAGSRIGFVCASTELLAELGEMIGPWVLPGPSRYIAKQALMDMLWHRSTRNSLSESSKRLEGLLTEYGLKPDGATELFCWVKSECAKSLYQKFAEKGVLLRLFTEPASLRFGLPEDEPAWKRLEYTLSQVMEEIKDKAAL